jgi:pSer/pThr/pTyr-binding forkhead associated (FHA) protein
MTAYWLKYRGTRFPIRGGDTTIGRSHYSNIVVGDVLASRIHCRVRMRGDELLIEDAGSSNGTTVNNEKITRTQILQVGDIIGVASDLLELQSAPEHDDRAETLKPPPDGGEPGSQIHDPTTGIHNVTVEYVERFAQSAQESSNPIMASSTIRTAVDTLIEHAETGEQPLGRAGAARLAAVTETVAEWFEDGSLDGWRGNVLARMSDLAMAERDD